MIAARRWRTMVDEKQPVTGQICEGENAAGSAHVAAPVLFLRNPSQASVEDEAEKGEVIYPSGHHWGDSLGMLSPCRTSTSSLRALVAATKAPQLVMAQVRSSRESPWPSSSSTAASSSRSGTSSSCRTLHSSIRRTEGVRTRPVQTDFPAPAVDLSITPKAAKTVAEAQAWLRNAFPGLPLPDDIAMMMITHESWDHGIYSGHNRRLSFLGESIYIGRGSISGS
jgi:hypothetical protein